MDSRELSIDQAAKLYDQLRPQLRYLLALRRRMEQCGFPPDDELRQLVERAYDAVHRLSVELHYLSCPSGVSQRRR
jgi:hypothetical protein